MYTPKGKKQAKPIFDAEGDPLTNPAPAPIEYDYLIKRKDVYDLRSTIAPTSYTPQISESDRNRGYIIRYFLEHKQSKKVIEVSRKTFDAIIRKSTDYHHPSYLTASVQWNIRGPVADQEINGYIVEGLQTTNEYFISELEKVLPNIRTYLTDPTQFVE